MKVQVLVLEWDEDPNTFDREKFIDVFRKHWRPLFPNHGEPNLEMALREIVKNFYDHASGKGVLKTIICGNTIEFEAYDFGPGYMGSSEDKSFDTLRKQILTTKNTSINFGLGLSTVGDAFDYFAKKGCLGVSLTVQTCPRFHYKGSYTRK